MFIYNITTIITIRTITRITAMVIIIKEFAPRVPQPRPPPLCRRLCPVQNQ